MKKNIGIIGNGFVGKAIANGFALHANVFVHDKDVSKTIHSLEEVVNNCNYIFIAVPTPMESVEGGKINLSIIDSVLDEIYTVEKTPAFSYENIVFVIKSTVIPGTTDSYRKKWPKFRIVFNPEFLTERSANLDFINANRIVLGGDERDCKFVEKLYRDRFPYTKVVSTDAKSAEMIKYACNCFFATKVSFMNEIRLLSDSLGCNWDDVLHGFISDGRIGNSHIDVPGHDGDFGFGGKCFPKDINAFMQCFVDNDIDPLVLSAAWERNKVVRNNIDWAKIPGAVKKDETGL